MELTKDAIELIQSTAVKAAGVNAEIFTTTCEPTGTYFLRDKDGLLERHVADQLVRRTALNIGTVAAWLAHASNAKAAWKSIWYSRVGVQAVYHEIPVETCTLALRQSQPLKTLAEWDKLPKGFEVDQQSLFRLFRTTFADSMSQHPDIFDLIKRVDFKKAQEVSGTAERKGVSMSRALVAEASGADKLPSFLTFEVPVYDTPTVAAKARVRVSFDLDAQAERFRLTVLPGEIESAEVEGEAVLYKMIFNELESTSKDIPIYYGSAT